METNEITITEDTRYALVVQQMGAVVPQISIKDQADYVGAAAVRKQIKDALKAIELQRKARTEPLDQEKKAIMAWARSFTDKLDVFEAAIASKMRSYDEQARLAQLEEQRRVNEQLEAKARAEREVLEARALAAIEIGKDELAEALVVRASEVVVPEVILKPVGPAASGVSYREIHKFEVTDASLLPREFLTIDEKKLGEFARKTKGFTPVAGVRFYSEKQLIQR